ncbi:MAG: hypothetical protein QOI99_407 [Actinomycetota bacterium]|nr:hypothetical protein [Actinomycetota bacterium]
MNDTAQLSALLSDYLEQLDRRIAAVDDLRREADSLGPHASAEVLPVLDAVDRTVRRSDESTRVLLRWLEAGSN